MATDASYRIVGWWTTYNRAVMKYLKLALAAALPGAVMTVLATSANVGAQSIQPQDPITILDRVYSVAQAERGQARFKQSCGSCHAVSEFAEPDFSGRWQGQTLGDVFEFISTAMPEGSPGSLKPEDYASILAYALSNGGFPVGTDDLPARKEVLAKIGIVSNPK